MVQARGATWEGMQSPHLSQGDSCTHPVSSQPSAHPSLPGAEWRAGLGTPPGTLDVSQCCLGLPLTCRQQNMRSSALCGPDTGTSREPSNRRSSGTKPQLLCSPLPVPLGFRPPYQQVPVLSLSRQQGEQEPTLLLAWSKAKVTGSLWAGATGPWFLALPSCCGKRSKHSGLAAT